MHYMPYELVKEVIKYFRGYENDQKKRLKLGQKDEYICNLATKYYCKIIDEERCKLKYKILKKISQHYEEIFNVIQDKISIKDIKIYNYIKPEIKFSIYFI